MSDTPIFDNVDNPPDKGGDITPNVKVENPDTRRTLTTVAGIVGAVLGTVLVVDLATPAFDLATWTDPITAGFLYLSSYYGIAVVLPNTPTRK